MSDLIRRGDLLDLYKVKEEYKNYSVPLPVIIQNIKDMLAVDAVEVVRCKDCRWAKPYERFDGEIGLYCHFCGHSFKYGERLERLFTPIKEKDDFCSYGERRDENAVD